MQLLVNVIGMDATRVAKKIFGRNREAEGSWATSDVDGRKMWRLFTDPKVKKWKQKINNGEELGSVVKEDKVLTELQR